MLQREVFIVKPPISIGGAETVEMGLEVRMGTGVGTGGGRGVEKEGEGEEASSGLGWD